MLIRNERPSDQAAVYAVNSLAFEQPAEAELVLALHRADKAVIALVAELEGEVVGHILFSPVSVEGQPADRRGLGLAPMAVHPEHQRGGIGGRLVEAGLAAARDGGFDFAVVLGHPTYYPRFGFVPASRFQLRCEYGVPDEVFMALSLRPGALDGVAGLVRYVAEFAMV
jgi:putative acetyltransferase